jgi:hypothetical protein
MENELAFLLNALKVAAIDDKQAERVVVPIADVLAVALAGIALDDETRLMLAALAATADDESDLSDALPLLYRAAEQIGAQLREQPDLATQVGERNAVLSTIIAIDALSSTDTITSLDVRVDRHFLDYIREIYIRTPDPQPDVILVGTSAAAPTEVRLRGQSFVEKRTTIHYHAIQGYPEINIATRAKQEIKPDWRDPPDDETRLSYLQKTTPLHDIKVSTYKDRPMGKIQTRLANRSLDEKGIRLKLSALPALAGATLMTTEILDERERVVMQCMWVVSRLPQLGSFAPVA